ncbi:MAG: UDP-2,3-diacylglucosamine diphosphatase LpxI [Limnochordia bacterium]
MAQVVGLIAGAGRLPRVWTERAKERGARVAVIRAVPGAFEDAKDSGADVVVDVFAGEWGRVVGALKEHGVARVYLVGKIARQHLFGQGVFDERCRAVLAQVDPRGNDDALIEAFVADLAREGIEVGPQADYLDHLLVPAGVIGRRTPTAAEWRDLERAYEVAKALAGLDVGQTAVVKDGAVLAVEAIDGTDRTIARGLAVARGGVVMKVAKPRQDPRFDMPVIGMDTLRTVVEHGGSVLAFDAHLTFLLDREECVAYADRHGVSLVSYVPGMERSGGK